MPQGNTIDGQAGEELAAGTPAGLLDISLPGQVGGGAMERKAQRRGEIRHKLLVLVRFFTTELVIQVRDGK